MHMEFAWGLLIGAVGILALVWAVRVLRRRARRRDRDWGAAVEAQRRKSLQRAATDYSARRKNGRSDQR